MSITYGKTTPTSYSDPDVKQINLSATRVGDAVRPGAYLVDTYPFLKHIPFFTSELKRFHREELALYRSQVQGVKARLVSPAYALRCRNTECALSDTFYRKRTSVRRASSLRSWSGRKSST